MYRDIDHMKEYIKDKVERSQEPEFLFTLFIECLRESNIPYIRFRRCYLRARNHQLNLFCSN